MLPALQNPVFRIPEGEPKRLQGEGKGQKRPLSDCFPTSSPRRAPTRAGRRHLAHPKRIRHATAMRRCECFLDGHIAQKSTCLNKFEFPRILSCGKGDDYVQVLATTNQVPMAPALTGRLLTCYRETAGTGADNDDFLRRVLVLRQLVDREREPLVPWPYERRLLPLRALGREIIRYSQPRKTIL